MRPLVPPPLLALAAGVAMWLTARWSPGLAFDFPGQAWAAGACVAAGLALDLTSVAGFLRARTTVNPLAPARASQLVVTGFYRISRNPMYLGLLLLLCGWAVWLGHLAAALWVPPFALLLTELQIKPEERALADRFGADYDAYRRRVRRWI